MGKSTTRLRLRLELTEDEVKTLKALTETVGLDSVTEYMIYAIREFTKHHVALLAAAQGASNATNPPTDTDRNPLPSGESQEG